jgi:hypothetical protein
MADMPITKPTAGATGWNTANVDTAAAFGDPSNEPNGAPTALDSGQAVTTFGNAPITIAAGKYTHTPVAGVSAGYMQTQLTSRVRRIGASVSWASGANGQVVLVIPGTPWTDTPSPVRSPAGVHLVMAGNGIWSCSSYAAGVETKYLRYETHGRFADCRDGIPRDVEVVIDPDRALIWITLPDGQVVVGTSPRITDTTASHAIWEFYEPDGATTTTGQITRVWADDKVEAGRAGSGPGKVAAVTAARRDPISNPVVGQYFIPVSSSSVATVLMTNQRLVLAPWVVRRPITLDRLAAEVTVVGEAGSKVRLGIYADNGTQFPSALVVDAGQINGDSATLQELTIDTALQPGLYWIGAVAQSAATTPPTIRTCGAAFQPAGPIGVSAVLAAMTSGLLNAGYYVTPVAGALAATISSAVPTAATNLPRLIARASASPNLV